MQIEVIRDLRERKMQIVLDEREGGYGIELLNYTSIEGIVGPMELGVDGKVHYIYSFGDKIPISEYIKKENPDEKKNIPTISSNIADYTKCGRVLSCTRGYYDTLGLYFCRFKSGEAVHGIF